MICLFHKWKLAGLYYEEFYPVGDNYGLRTYEVYKCTKCSKEKSVKKDTSLETFSYLQDEKIKRLAKNGFENIYNEKKKLVNNMKG